MKLRMCFNSVLVWSSPLYLWTRSHIPGASGCLNQSLITKQPWGTCISVRVADSTFAYGRYFHVVAPIIPTSRLSRNFQLQASCVQGNFYFVISLTGQNVWKWNNWSASGEIIASCMNCKISPLTFQQAIQKSCSKNFTVLKLTTFCRSNMFHRQGNENIYTTSRRKDTKSQTQG